jgi:hypothetical protein
METLRATDTPQDTQKLKKKRSRRQPPPLPAAAAATEMQEVKYACRVDSSPISWDALPIWHAFSLSSDGSYPQVKVSKSQFCDLRTGKSYAAGSGRCYRVIF